MDRRRITSISISHTLPKANPDSPLHTMHHRNLRMGRTNKEFRKLLLLRTQTLHHLRRRNLNHLSKSISSHRRSLAQIQ